MGQKHMVLVMLGSDIWRDFSPSLAKFKSRGGQRLTLWLRFINLFIHLFFCSPCPASLCCGPAVFSTFCIYFCHFISFFLLLSVGQLFRPKRLWSAQCVHKGSRMARWGREVGHLNGLKGSKMAEAEGGENRKSGEKGTQRDVWLLTGLCKLHKLGKCAKSVARFCATARQGPSVNRWSVARGKDRCATPPPSSQFIMWPALCVYLGPLLSPRLFTVVSVIGLVTRLQLQVLGHTARILWPHPVVGTLLECPSLHLQVEQVTRERLLRTHCLGMCTNTKYWKFNLGLKRVLLNINYT